MADVQRAGRVGRDELDVDPLRGRGAARAERRRRRRARRPSASTYHASDRKRFRKPGPGDLDALQLVAEVARQRVAERARRRRAAASRAPARAAAPRWSSSRRSRPSWGARASARCAARPPWPSSSTSDRAASDGGAQVVDRVHERACAAGSNSASRRSIVRGVPIAMTTSPSSSTVSAAAGARTAVGVRDADDDRAAADVLDRACPTPVAARASPRSPPCGISGARRPRRTPAGAGPGAPSPRPTVL